jgi:hypothetical protein
MGWKTLNKKSTNFSLVDPINGSTNGGIEEGNIDNQIKQNVKSEKSLSPLMGRSETSNINQFVDAF